jgi:DNA repair protein RAD5
MKHCWTTYISLSNTAKIPSTNETELKLIGYYNHYILIQINNIFMRLPISSTFEKLVYFEIMNESPLWSYEYIIDTIHSTIIKGTIEISIEPSIIEHYLDKSMALNNLLSIEYDSMPTFTKFDNSTSYFPEIETFEPPETFKFKLYNYQKRSLCKMIKIEQQKIDYSIEYTTSINFKNILNINYDPIKNIKSKTTKYFKIQTKGGILADEMGLGKTITTLALISSNPSTDTTKLKYSVKDGYHKLNSKATIIICPSHIIKQWESEAKKSNPNLKILVISTRKDHERLYFNDFINADIIITSHQFLMNFKYYPCLYYRNILPSTFNANHRNNALKELYLEHINSASEIDDDVYEAIKHHELPIFEFFNFHRLVLDEGHEIFGEMLSNQSLSKYMSSWLTTISANSQWYVSGSPFINFTGLINCIKYLNLRLIDDDINFEINNTTFENTHLFNNVLNKHYLWNNILKKICIRHCKNDISNEVSIYGYQEKIEWIKFTELEQNLYDSKKNKNNKEQLQQLCCHLLILDSCRKIFGDENIDLSVMQTKLINHHTSVIETYTNKLSKLTPTNQAYHMIKKSYENSINESKYILSMLNKLDNNETLDTETNCSICLEDIVDGSITSCGHIYCSECIKTCLKYKKICPMCKKTLSSSDIYVINKSDKIKPIDNPLIEKYGSKLGKIIGMIRTIVIVPDSRIIIFSQWDFMLTLIGKTLSENGIANCFVRGNVWARNSAISKFKNGKTLSGEDNKVIMLSLQNSASGTNLTEATHIFFVEPINACKEEVNAIEGQALARACRLGQKQKVEVYRVLIENTIEEEIYNKIYK